ncbi:MAG: TetR/AcrR family transcriptional regulator [Christensenellales bacterium]
MEQEKEDLRIKRTRKLLCMSLMDLMQTKSFEKLSVNDICEKAMVHRATFYNHFNDKNDLLNYALDDLQEELFERSIEKETFSSQKEMFMALVECVIDFITKNRQKFVLIYKNSSEKMSSLVSTTIKRSIRYLISRNKYKQEYLLPIDIIVNFFTGGITIIGIDWLESSNPYTKEEMMQFFDILLNEDMFVKRSLV